MRLLGCHIEGFGSFANFDISFDEGLNVVFQPNGWGKTTISAFIDAMLYGFARKRVHNVKENKRLRYAPWMGGRYGGSLDLQSGGRCYRIKRVFGKTQAGDRTEVIDIDTGRKIDVEAPTIGEWLLGLDSSAFQRSVFIGHDGIEFDGPVAGLRNRLNALVGEAEDAPRFDQAINTLDERRRYYQKIGNRGRIAEIDRDIDGLLQRYNTLESFVQQSRELQAQEASLKKDLEQIDSQLAMEQEGLEVSRKAEQELAALAEVRKSLVNRKEESESALQSFRTNTPYKFGDIDVKGLTVQEESIVRLKDEVTKTDAQLDALAEQITQVKARYGGSIPTKDEMEARSSQIATLKQVRDELDSLLTDTAEQPSFVSLNPASVPIEQAQSLLASWPSVETNMLESERIKLKMHEVDVAWTIARKRVLDAKARVDTAKANVPDNVDEHLLRLNGAVDELRECLQIKEQLNVQMSVLKAKLEAAGEKTERNNAITNVDIARIDQLVNELRTASEAVTPLRQQVDSFEAQIRDLNDRREAEQATLLDARSKVANAELERATAVREEADARSAYDAQVSNGGKKPLMGIACVIIGLVFGAIGVLSFLPLLVVAAALLVFGVLRIKADSEQSSKSSASKKEVTRAADRLEECERAWQKEQDELRSIEARYNAVDADCTVTEERLAAASEALDQALTVEHDIKDELTREVNRLLPGEDLDTEVVVAQIDVLRKMLVTASNARDERADMRKRLSDYEMASHANDAKAKLACERVGIITNGDIANDLDRANAKVHEISSYKNYLEEARENLDKALADVPNYYGTTEKPSLEEVVSSEHYPECDEQVKRVSKVDEELERYKRTLVATLNEFGLESTSDQRMDVERLRKALDDYKAKRQDWSRSEQQIEKKRMRERELTEELDSWARSLALGGERELNENLINTLRKDVDLVERLGWELERTNAKKNAANEQMRAMQKTLRAKLTSYGVSQTMELREAVDSLSKNASVLFDLEKEYSSSCETLVAWDKENGQRLETLRNARRKGSLTIGERTVAEIRRSREDLLTQVAQCTERREADLREAEEYPKVLQRIALLAQEKQGAVSNLATVKGASEYLQQARERIDGRYLSSLVSRFNEYSVAWLGTDMGLDVNGELEVTVSEGDKPHDIAYYSTGYREILGVCLRMAFVDTIFEQEEPFLVMDDPFANLDQHNLDKAFSVLQSIGKRRQIVYFTCHHSRAGLNNLHDETDFVLPQKRESLELPQVMARRDAEERAKKQTALVAAYHVTPVTQGRASIELADDRRVVSNNIFNLRFVVKNGSGGRDNAFEAFFIDENGKVLCEKMSIEIRNGHVVPERLRFRLVTSENSGDKYELIIHEQGREQTELVSRTAFRAEVAFVSEDFGF